LPALIRSFNFFISKVKLKEAGRITQVVSTGRKSFDKLTRTEKIAGTSHAVGPDVGIKSSPFFQKLPKK